MQNSGRLILKHPSRSFGTFGRKLGTHFDSCVFKVVATLRRFSPEASRGLVFARDREGRLAEGFRGRSSLCGLFAPTPLEACVLQGIVKVALRRGWVSLHDSEAVFFLGLLSNGF